MNWVILVGFMGAGKSTLGQELAEKMQIQFVDTDHVIEIQQGRSISNLFDELGEKRFRELEANYIRDLDTEKKMVIALGGGLPIFHENMDYLNAHGTTIYLKHETNELYQRLFSDRIKRPLLAQLSEQELLAYIEENKALRAPYYNQAKHILSTEKQDVSTILELIQKKN
jgi:shikimate kinase